MTSDPPEPTPAPAPSAEYLAWRAAPKAPAPRPRSWIVAVVVVWAAVLVGGILWAVDHGEPTARDQTTVQDALPVVDRAAGTIVAAVNTDGQAVAAISGLSKAADCTISVLRDGTRYQRVVSVFVAPGTEEALLGRLAERLPSDWHATVRTGAAPRLTADAGLYVGVTATVGAPGTVRFVIDTGDCRPGDLIVADMLVNPTPAQQAAIDQAMSFMGTTTRETHVYRSGCPGGGVVSTAEAEGEPGTKPGPLSLRFAVSSAHQLVSSPDLVGYRIDDVAISARAIDDTVVVTATTPCPTR